MADFAQILLLPPPTPYPQRLPAREQDLAVNAEAQGTDAARAKRFRFRIYEGGESSETNTDLATRQAGGTALNNDGSTEDATGQSSSRSIRYSRSDTGSGSSRTFLAQSFAQEQLGAGLHNPPFAAATAAYSRTGAALDTRVSAGLDIRA